MEAEAAAEAAKAEEAAATEEPVVEEEKSFHQVLKEKFIEGGPEFMGIVLVMSYLRISNCN